MGAGVSCFFVEPETSWLFVGLASGVIRAFQSKPLTELSLEGHTSAVTQIIQYDKFLISVSRDQTYRVQN